MKMFLIGFFLVFGAVGTIEQMPPTATTSDWIWILSIAAMGLIVAAVGVMDMKSE